jgi:hypothetical protein
MQRFLSLGLGVQSTALYYMSSMGELPPCDLAIFADLGKEKKGTIAYLKYLQRWQKENNGIPIVVVRKKNLYRDLLIQENSTGQRFASIPAYTMNEDGTTGMLRRQCTKEYKIEQVDTAIREALGLRRIINQKLHLWKGISLEEIDRMSVPDTQWKVHIYPFCNYEVSKEETNKIDYGILKSRNDIIAWYNEKGLPVPPKSSCVFCPYQSEAAWYDMKVNHPSDFKAAVRVDRAIRNSSKKGIKQQVFLHESGVPLEDVVFKAGLPDLWHGECSGNCHT